MEKLLREEASIATIGDAKPQRFCRITHKHIHLPLSNVNSIFAHLKFYNFMVESIRRQEHISRKLWKFTFLIYELVSLFCGCNGCVAAVAVRARDFAAARIQTKALPLQV